MSNDPHIQLTMSHKQTHTHRPFYLFDSSLLARRKSAAQMLYTTHTHGAEERERHFLHILFDTSIFRR